ncbi:MAG: response regulator [Candidatus Omnitrophica bacterium]|nr:response regulator [Candidatus Omnitrophota bacterium]
MKKILICEDEKDAQKTLEQILRRRNYQVACVDNGQDAIVQTKEFSPDLILLDIRMPKIDGLEVARQIRSFNKLVKIIFISAFASPEIEREAAQFDICDYLVKPVSNEDILKKIESCFK